MKRDKTFLTWMENDEQVLYISVCRQISCILAPSGFNFKRKNDEKVVEKSKKI